METHIKRRHAGAGRRIPKMPNAPLQSPANNWLGDLSKSTSPDSIFSTSKDDPLGLFSTTNDHSPDLQRDIIEALGTIKEINQLRSYIAPGLNAVPPMNLDFSDGRTTLGYKGYMCEKCLSWQIQQIFDDEKITSLKSRHACDRQRLYDAQFVTDIPRTIHRRREELIFYLTIIVNDIAKQQELVDLRAVEIPSSVFDNRSDSYEEYVDLDSLSSRTPDWAYRAVKEGKTVINKTDLAKFLDIFEGTFGFCRRTINGVKLYFFVYITKGLESWDIKYLKKLLRVQSPTTTEIAHTQPQLPVHECTCSLNCYNHNCQSTNVQLTREDSVQAEIEVGDAIYVIWGAEKSVFVTFRDPNTKKWLDPPVEIPVQNTGRVTSCDITVTETVVGNTVSAFWHGQDLEPLVGLGQQVLPTLKDVSY